MAMNSLKIWNFNFFVYRTEFLEILEKQNGRSFPCTPVPLEIPGMNKYLDMILQTFFLACKIFRPKLYLKLNTIHKCFLPI